MVGCVVIAVVGIFYPWVMTTDNYIRRPLLAQISIPGYARLTHVKDYQTVTNLTRHCACDLLF